MKVERITRYIRNAFTVQSRPQRSHRQSRRSSLAPGQLNTLHVACHLALCFGRPIALRGRANVFVGQTLRAYLISRG
jgi:hypothetical protein